MVIIASVQRRRSYEALESAVPGGPLGHGLGHRDLDHRRLRCLDDVGELLAGGGEHRRRLVECSHHGDRSRPQVLRGEGEPAGGGAGGTHYSGRGRQVPLREQVHVATHAAAQAIGGPHAFLDDGRRVHAAKDHARSTTMVKGHRVTVSEVIEHARVNALFSDPEVHLTGYTSFLPETSDRFFNPPTRQHLAVECNSIQFHLFFPKVLGRTAEAHAFGSHIFDFTSVPSAARRFIILIGNESQ